MALRESGVVPLVADRVGKAFVAGRGGFWMNFLVLLSGTMTLAVRLSAKRRQSETDHGCLGAMMTC